jgi:hypothetical protein
MQMSTFGWVGCGSPYLRAAERKVHSGMGNLAKFVEGQDSGTDIKVVYFGWPFQLLFFAKLSHAEQLLSK